MHANHSTAALSIRRELRTMLRQGRHVWQLVPRRFKAGFGGTAVIMALTAAANTAVPVLLGRLVDEVPIGTRDGISALEMCRWAAIYLGLIAGAYVIREFLQVIRRYLVENSCTRLEKIMTVRLVSHLMKIDLGCLAHEKIGAVQGRISRSVVGFVRFLRLIFLDFLPPLFTGTFALLAALSKQPWLALAMVGVIPMSVYLTIRQIKSQKGVRLQLLRSREEMEGTVVELLGGMDYVRAANTQQYEIERVARTAEKRRAKSVRKKCPNWGQLARAQLVQGLG